MAGSLDTLSALLRSHLGELLRRPVEVRALRRLAGGTSHETWAFDLIDGARVEPLVARRDIADGALESDGAAEFALLGTLHALGQPVPRPWVHVPAEEPGRPAMTVLERVAGEDARKLLARRDCKIDRRALGGELVRIQAALHAVDWRRHLAGVALEPQLFGACAEVERWQKLIDAHRVDPQPLLVAAISWLRAHPPRPAPPRLVHGDFKANNLLISPDGRRTVLDWEMAHVGDPLEDLAWTLQWDTEFDLVGGMLAPAEYLAEYAAASETALDREALFFWQLFALVKLAAIFLTGVRLGAASLPTLAMLGRATPYLERQIAARLCAAMERGAV